MQELSFETVMNRLTAELLCDLHYYADQHSTDFESVLAAGYRAMRGSASVSKARSGPGRTQARARHCSSLPPLRRHSS